MEKNVAIQSRDIDVVGGDLRPVPPILVFFVCVSRNMTFTQMCPKAKLKQISWWKL